MTTDVAGERSRILLAASRPSTSSIRMSRRATSGLCRSTRLTASAPLEASATTWISSAPSR